MESGKLKLCVQMFLLLEVICHGKGGAIYSMYMYNCKVRCVDDSAK